MDLLGSSAFSTRARTFSREIKPIQPSPVSIRTLPTIRKEVFEIDFCKNPSVLALKMEAVPGMVRVSGLSNLPPGLPNSSAFQICFSQKHTGCQKLQAYSPLLPTRGPRCFTADLMAWLPRVLICASLTVAKGMTCSDWPGSGPSVVSGDVSAWIELETGVVPKENLHRYQHQNEE